MSERPTIAVVGAGAIGPYYGGRLVQHGHDVHFLLRSDYQYVKQHGWKISSCHGDFSLSPQQIHVHSTSADMPKADLVLVTLKTTSNHLYEPLIRPLLKDQTVILTLQNGLGNEERLAQLFGEQRILGGIAFVCINRIAPGVIAHTAEGLIRIGELRGPATPRARQVVQVFRDSNIPCETIDDLARARWQKLVWNIPFNCLGAALDLSTDQLLASEQGVELVRSIMEEVVTAARAVGIELPRDIVQQQIDFTRPMAAYKTSMQIDREAGRALEVDAILCEPLRRARSAGAALPRLQMLCQLVNLGKLGNSSTKP